MTKIKIGSKDILQTPNGTKVVIDLVDPETTLKIKIGQATLELYPGFSSSEVVEQFEKLINKLGSV